MTKRKVKGLYLVAMLLIFCTMLFVFAACDPDKDKNGVDDRKESEGTYLISVTGQEHIRRESFTISNVQANLSGNIEGSIYSEQTKTTYTFTSQTVTIREYEGNIWYGWVNCTDGYDRRIYFRRTGIGDYVATGSVNIGGEGHAGDVGGGGNIGIGYTYTVYNEYGHVTYAMYDVYSYTKK